MAERADAGGAVVAATSRAAADFDGRCEGGVGPAAARIGAGAPGVGRPAGGVVVRWGGFVDGAALCGFGESEAAEDVFGVVPGTELRRESVFPRDRADLWNGPPRIRPEPGYRTAGRD